MGLRGSSAGPAAPAGAGAGAGPSLSPGEGARGEGAGWGLPGLRWPPCALAIDPSGKWAPLRPRQLMAHEILMASRNGRQMPAGTGGTGRALASHAHPRLTRLAGAFITRRATEVPSSSSVASWAARGQLANTGRCL